MAWMIASSAASVMLVFFRILSHPLIGICIIGLNAALLAVMAWQLFFARNIRYRLIFIAANLFMLLVMAGLVADALLKGL
jgi:hypothetical protein